MPQSLEDLKEEYKELGFVNDRQEKRVQELESKIFQIATFYLIFQGIVLTSISQATSLTCRNWWIPFSVSLISAILNGCTMVHSMHKYYRTSWHLDANRLERAAIRRRINSYKESNASRSSLDNSSAQRLQPDIVKWFRRKIYLSFTLIFLLAFTGFILLGCRRILCNQ